MTTQENTQAGTLDRTFNRNGMLPIDYGDPAMGEIYINEVREERGPYPGIYFIGNSVTNGGGVFTVGRLNLDGTPDESFGPNNTGLQQVRVPNRIMLLGGSFAIQDDGMIIMGSHATHPSKSIFARFKPNGELDLEFGVNGFAIVPFGDNGETQQRPDAATRQGAGGLMGIELLPGGFILASHIRGVILRLTPDGELDKSFNGKGFLEVTHPDYPVGSIDLCGVMKHGEGKYVAAGTIFVYPNRAIFFCCDDTGNVDTSFGSERNGFVVIGGALENEGIGIDRLIRHRDGRLPGDRRLLGVGGDYAVLQESGLMISRESDGKPNIDFNRGEPLYTRLNDEKMQTLWMGAAYQKEDGKTVTAGMLKATVGNVKLWAVVARFNANGEMDKTFGEGGWAKTLLPAPNGGHATNVSLQKDGKILVCAVPFMPPAHHYSTILRYLY